MLTKADRKEIKELITLEVHKQLQENATDKAKQIERLLKDKIKELGIR